MTTGALIVWLATLWLYAGGVVAALFLLVGIDRISDEARGAYLFRPLLVPGILLLWPLVLWRWFSLERGLADGHRLYRPVRDAHGHVWMVLAIVIPAILITAMLVRQTPPAANETIRLEAPAQ